MFMSMFNWLTHKKESSDGDSKTTKMRIRIRIPVTFDTVETARLPSEHLEAETKLYLGKFVTQIIALGNRSAEIRETLAEAALHGKDT